MSRYQWEKARRRILERDEHQCVRCFHTSGLQVHHRHPRQAGGTKNPEIAWGAANLVTLCAWCHDYVERNRSIAERFGYLVRGRTRPSSVPVWSVAREWVLLDDDYGVTPVRDIPEEITA